MGGVSWVSVSPCGIAAAIQTLVMRCGQRRQVLAARNAGQDVLRDDRMPLDLGELRPRERRWLVEDAVRDRELPDVMQ
jgi:hypothetical protein